MEVYIALNRINDKAYVGWTKDTARKRFINHCACAKRGSSTYFHKAIRKYGVNVFDVQTIAKVSGAFEREIVNQLEVFCIAFLRTHINDGGYNLTKGGEGAVARPLSEKTKQALSHGHQFAAKSRLGMKYGKSRRTLRRHRAEERTRLGIEYSLSDETCTKLSEAAKGKQKRLGAVLSENTKQKIAVALRGKPWSAARRAAQQGVEIFQK